MLSFITQQLIAQIAVKGKILDARTKEPVQGATISCTHEGCNGYSITDSHGEFELKCNHCATISISSVGYSAQDVPVNPANNLIALVPSQSLLQQVVISANRGEAVKRSQAPSSDCYIKQ